MCHLTAKDPEVIIARSQLSVLMVSVAKQKALQSRMMFRGSNTPPSTVPALQHEYQRARDYHLPLPVAQGRAQNGIYDSQASDQSYRFWHDVNHVELGCGFSIDDEVTVMVRQLETVQAAGIDHRSNAFKLLHGDTVGQMLCYATLGRYPYNRLDFAIGCLADGVDIAVREESHRRPPCRPVRHTASSGSV